MNVDPLEVNKFDEMAMQWWDLEGPCKPLHALNPLRLAFIQSCCTLENQRIVDIGCGGGILTEKLSHFSPYVVGIDQSLSALEIARVHALALPHPPTYQPITAEDYALEKPEQFDVITCMELLEHVPSPLSLITACARLLKPNGHLFFSTLNRTPKAFLHAIIGAEYIFKMLPKGTHDYARFLRPSEVAQLSRSQNLFLKEIKGISYRLFNKSYYLSNDASVNYLMHLQKDES